jgi:hypothetical protein
MKTFFLIIILFICLNVRAQDKQKRLPLTMDELPYFFKMDSTDACSLVSFKFQYYSQIPNGFFRVGGTHIDVGLNIARLFTSKFILGIGFDHKSLPFQGKQQLSAEFVNDFNVNYTPVTGDFYDSIRSETLFRTINNISGYEIMSSTFSHLCLNFSPFPDKYGGVLFQFKYGYSTIRVKAPLLTDGYDDSKATLAVATKNNIGLEISFNPYKIFNTHRKKLVNTYPKGWFKFLIVSLYYEKMSLNKSTFGGEPLNKFVSQNFTDNYSNVQSYGIKVGIGIW